MDDAMRVLKSRLPQLPAGNGTDDESKPLNIQEVL